MVGGGCDAVRGADGCVTLANCSNYQTVREERPARTHWIQQIWGGKAKWRQGVGGYDRGRKKRKKNINRELDGFKGTESRRPALETSRVPSSGLVSAPNQLQGCSRSGLELSPYELIIMKKHSARVAPLSACNSPVLTLTKVEGRESSYPFRPPANPQTGAGVFCLLGCLTEYSKFRSILLLI